MIYQPGTRVGLFPTRLHADATGVEFNFTLFSDGGGLAGSALFRSLDSAALTGAPDQNLNSARIGKAWDTIPVPSSDARLVTVTNPPSVSTLQRVRLFVAGFQIGEWDVEFASVMPSFSLDGRWS